MSTVSWLTPGLWTTAFNGADLNSLANGSGILSTATAIANGSSLSLYADVDFILGSFTATAGGYLALYLLPLLHDGSTYPNSSNGGTAASQPQVTYCVGTIALGAQASVVNGIIRSILIPPGTFKLYLTNHGGNSLNAGSNSSQYRLYGETVA